MLINSPEEFEACAAPVAGDVCVQSNNRRILKGNLDVKRLNYIGFMLIATTPLSIHIEPNHDYYSVTLPLGCIFETHGNSQHHQFTTGTAHVFPPQSAFSLSTLDNCRILACIIYADFFAKYAGEINQSDHFNPSMPSLSLFTAEGSYLLRAIARLWSSIHTFYDHAGDINLHEQEDDVLASFVLATTQFPDDQINSTRNKNLCRKKAEEFMCDNLTRPITRDMLAQVSGVSIRTVSRAFVQHYGTGPIAFLKQQRMNAAYLELLSAQNDSTTVTNTALKYGFVHLGKFSIEYRRLFGESPSVTIGR